MELLKKLQAIPVILLIMTQVLSAQDFETTQAAFKQSFESESAGEYEKGINALKRVYSENSYEINVRLGWLSYLAGNFQESSAYYHRSIKLMPYAVEPKFGLAFPASALGQWDLVLQQYDKILEITPNNSIALFRSGMIYYGRKEYEKARGLFQKTLNLFPFDYDALNMMGWTYLMMGKSDEARIMFEKALYARPGGASAEEGLRSL